MTYIGIIGGGGISETHAKAATQIDGVQIAAVFGRNATKVTQLSESYGGRSYTDFESFLEHRPMDAVIIGSPSGMHAEQGIAAAHRGLHVLIEKPIDIKTTRADELIDECERANVKLAICYQDRFAPDIVLLKSLIDEGKLGKPILCAGYAKWYRPPSYYADSDWRGIEELAGGGTLINQGIHTVDAMLWLLGEVKNVYARAATALHEISVEDTLVANLEFANGTLGTIESTTSVYPGYDRRIEITGDQGTVIVERNRIIRADLKTVDPAAIISSTKDTNASSSSPIISDVSAHRRLIEDFLHAVAFDHPPGCDGRDGRRSLALVEAIYKSAKSGQPVDV
ncbi:MAG: oxidoreductase [Blastocatellia bacterium]|nr:MAG: oxidoreductase [Blastocatellia bacterium]